MPSRIQKVRQIAAVLAFGISPVATGACDGDDIILIVGARYI